MSLIVEDGTGLPSAESYTSVSSATVYHVKFGNAAWADYTETEQEVALRKATRYIDGHYDLRGQPKFSVQALSFPRYGYATNETWPEPNLEAACAELALRAIQDELIVDTEDAVILREVIGPLRTDYAYKSNQVRYPVVDALMKRFLFTESGSVRIGYTG